MVIIILLIAGSVFSFLTYCMYSTFKDSDWDIIGTIKYDKKGFFWTITGIIISLVVSYYCFVTPSYAISHQYYHKNGTITSVEYSLTGDSTIKNNIKAPKDTYGKVVSVKLNHRLNGKILNSYTEFTIELNDGRTMHDELSGDLTDTIKEGHGMSITETFYPSYKVDYNFN